MVEVLWNDVNRMLSANLVPALDVEVPHEILREAIRKAPYRINCNHCSLSEFILNQTKKRVGEEQSNQVMVAISSKHQQIFLPF